MKSRSDEPAAVFHERERMEAAVRALVAEGVRPQRIRIAEGRADDDVRSAPDAASVVGIGLILGGATGALFAWLYYQASTVAPSGLRILTSAVSGAIFGAMLAVLILVVHARPIEKPELRAKRGDFVVTVKLADEGAAATVLDVLTLRGGEPLTA
jgi:hypothetical protein